MIATKHSVEELISQSNLVVINEDTHTRLPYNDEDSPSSPDITLVTEDICLNTSWKTLNKRLSDHLPIVTQLAIELESSGRPHKHKRLINFRKADWKGFSTKLEELVEKLPKFSTVEQGEKGLRNAVQDAARSTIPKGRHHVSTPCLPAEIRKLIDKRDSTASSLEATNLNKEIQNAIQKDRAEKWMEFVEENSSLRTGNIWRALGKFTGKRKPQKNVALKFADQTVTAPTKIANRLNRFLAKSFPLKTSPATRKTKRLAAKIKMLEEVNIDPKTVKAAIKEMRNSKAIGPDSMATIHLKHFGPKALQLLSNVIAHSFSTGRMPMVWKTANVTPLQKPNKPAENPDSYRPVSILSPVARLAERLLLTEVKDATNLPQQQHGFRTGHSTVTAVSTLTEDIIHGFNSKRPPIRTVAVALDLKKAFDTVNIDQLIQLIL